MSKPNKNEASCLVVSIPAPAHSAFFDGAGVSHLSVIAHHRAVMAMTSGETVMAMVVMRRGESCLL